jgi:hypothetical protein
MVPVSSSDHDSLHCRNPMELVFNGWLRSLDVLGPLVQKFSSGGTRFVVSGKVDWGPCILALRYFRWRLPGYSTSSKLSQDKSCIAYS